MPINIIGTKITGHDQLRYNLKEQFKQKSIWVLTPIFGILIFVVLYIVAALLYPGGSQVDKNSIGFSWGK